jgi:hypothetical protein
VPATGHIKLKLFRDKPVLWPSEAWLSIRNRYHPLV